MTAGEILDTRRQDCIDGRSSECAVCTPGGDMGDLVMKLTAVEQTTGKEFGGREAQDILEKYLKHRHGAFYMHSDHHALEHLCKDLGVGREEAQALLENPRDSKEALLAALSNSDNMGCGHLKLMASKPACIPASGPH